jgi:hypothetical protein
MNEVERDDFLKNCGANAFGEGAVFHSNEGHALFSFSQQPFALIGRDSRNDVHLDFGSVSRRHAYVQLLEGAAFCVDLGSRTGVSWPDGPRPAGWLPWEQSIQFGEVELRLNAPYDPDGELPSVRERENPLDSGSVRCFQAAEATLEFCEGVKRTFLWRLNCALALAGSAPGCRINLPFADVSRFHCSLVSGPLGVWVVDLLSREGVWVNGERVRWARLKDGDRLRVGPVVMRLWYERGADDEALGYRPVADQNLSPTPAEGSPARIFPPPAAPPMPFPIGETGNNGGLALAMFQQFAVMQQQFHWMQQQMFEQFHQAMVMMTKTISTAHREQASTVRAELDEVRRLTRELQQLQEEQRRAGSAAPSEVASGPVPGGVKGGGRKGRQAAAPAQARAPVAPANRARNGEGTDQPRAAPPEGDKAAAAPAAADPSVHDWLSKQIAALQEERYGRWQKLLKFLSGS